MQKGTKHETSDYTQTDHKKRFVLISAFRALEVIIGNPNEKQKHNHPDIWDGYENMSRKGSMEVLIQIPIVVEKNIENSAKGQSAEKNGNQKEKPNKIVLKQELPARLWANFLFFYPPKNFLA
jgi:hypothetical protein